MSILLKYNVAYIIDNERSNTVELHFLFFVLVLLMTQAVGDNKLACDEDSVSAVTGRSGCMLFDHCMINILATAC